MQTWLYNNLATGQGESCDTCKRVQTLSAATDAAQAAVAQVAPVTQPPRASRQFFDKLIVWLNSNLPRLCAQLSRVSYQQKCVHKLTCSFAGSARRQGAGRGGEGEHAMPMLGQINSRCVCTLTFAANQQRANVRHAPRAARRDQLATMQRRFLLHWSIRLRSDVDFESSRALGLRVWA